MILQIGITSIVVLIFLFGIGEIFVRFPKITISILVVMMVAMEFMTNK